MQNFEPEVNKVLEYFGRFSQYRRSLMFFLWRYINEPDINSLDGKKARTTYKANYSKIKAICKEFGLGHFDNLCLIFLIISLYNSKEERIEAWNKATDYWLQLKLLIDEFKGYRLPDLLEPNKTDSNLFNEIRFYRKRDDAIRITNDKLIFNLSNRVIPFLQDQYEKGDYQQMLAEITPHIGVKNAQDGFRLYRDKLTFSANDYLTEEEPHLSQNKRSRVINELFDLTNYPFTISIGAITKRINRDKQTKK